MKKVTTLALLCIIIAVAFAQPPKKLIMKDESREVKEQLEELFRHASHKEYKKAAKIIAYKGADTTRKLKDMLNPAIQEELEQATAICMNINSIDSASYEKQFYQFYIQKQPEGLWHNWIMIYNMNSGKRDTATFGFLKIKDKFTLAGIK